MSESSEIHFRDLGLPPELLRAVEELGYEQPTPIQAGAIPPLLEGRDMLGQAQTGTGKTAAFALPLLAKLDLGLKAVQAIVLTPTRELAMQVAEAVRAYGKYVGKRGVHVLPVYGGQPMHIQRKALRSGVHVVIGTPGRVKDHLERGSLNLHCVSFFGLDEADEMLNMGFLDDVEWILDQAPAERQIALFSATLPRQIRRVAEKHLKDVADVKIEHKTLTVENTEQQSVRVGRYEKREALERLLEVDDYEAVLIFVGTQRGAGELAEHLQGRGLQAECIHGGMNQSQRDAVVKRLRGRMIQFLVATDVAARGLDVEHIELVVNFDLPRDQEVYVHRVGRTGRMGRVGRSITFWQHRDRYMLQSIERFIGQRMEPIRVPGRAEMLDRRRARFAEKIRTVAAAEPDGDTEAFLDLVGVLASENELTLSRVAAAAARIAWGEAPLTAEPDPHADTRREPGETTEIVIPIGKLNQVRPKDIVGAIAGESKLPGHVVGDIRILDKVTFVTVPTQHAQKILAALEGARICGRNVRPRLAHPEGGDRGPRGDRPPRHGRRPKPRRPRR